MEKINLIPADLRVGGTTNKVSKTLNQLTVIMAGISVFAIIAILGFFFFYSSELKKATLASDGLKKQISSLEQSEQKLIFAKDRLEKISQVKNMDTALEEIAGFNLLYSFLKIHEDMSVTDVSMDTKKLEISILSTSLGSITSFYEFLDVNKKEFERVSVSIFSFNPSAGYILNLVFF